MDSVRDEILKKQKLIQNNIINSFNKDIYEVDKPEKKEEEFESSLNKGGPKNKWQKIIYFKWKDAIQNNSFREYVKNELGVENLEDISFTEQERLLRDKDYISKGEEDKLKNDFIVNYKNFYIILWPFYNNEKDKNKSFGYKITQDLNNLSNYLVCTRGPAGNYEEALNEAKQILNKKENNLNEELEKADIGTKRKIDGKMYEKRIGGDWICCEIFDFQKALKELSLEEVIKKYDLPIDGLKNQIKLGLSVEKHHSDDIDTIFQIVLNNLYEDKDYYSKGKEENWVNNKMKNETRRNLGDVEELEKEKDNNNPFIKKEE